MPARSELSRVGIVALAAVPLLLTVWLAFNAGGFFAGEPATAAVVLALALAVRALVAPRPLEGLGAAALVPAVALAALTAWTLLSATWSDATGRALVEHCRPLAYGLAFVLLAAPAFSAERLRWLLRASAAVVVGIALAGLVTRVLPEVWSVEPSLRPGRLAYPITYWNGMGLLATLAALLCLHLACDDREPPWIRAVAAGVVPALTVTVLLTFSRGAIAAGLVGLVAYLLLARPRGALLGIAATLPTSAFALVVAYDADALASLDPSSPAAVAQGRDVATAALLCGLVAAAPVAIWATRELRRRQWAEASAHERRLPRARSGHELSPAGRWAVGGAAALFAVMVALAAGAPAAVSDQVDRFLDGDAVPDTADSRDRLTDLGNNGRLEGWEIALDAFAENRLQGRGAGTYQVVWNQEAPRLDSVVDAHSLYVESLGELGLVGFALVLVMVLGILGGLLARVRAPARSRVADVAQPRAPARAMFAIVTALWLTWALRAGLDWDWELPAVALWLFALAGAALAARRDDDEAAALAARRDDHEAPAAPPTPAGWALRGVGVVACLAIAFLPLAVAGSQASLDSAVASLRAGDGHEAARSALDGIDALGARAEPWEAYGYAALLLDRPDQAIPAMEAALERDPGNWEPAYGLAIARAAAGKDARGTIRRAVALSPYQRIAQELMWALDDATPRQWPAVARKAPLLIPPELDAATAALGAGPQGRVRR